MLQASFTCEVVLRLANVHPVAWKCEGKQLSIAADEREGLLLDGCGPHLNTVQHCRAQAVDACIDLVAHKHLQTGSTIRSPSLKCSLLVNSLDRVHLKAPAWPT